MKPLKHGETVQYLDTKCTGSHRTESVQSVMISPDILYILNCLGISKKLLLSWLKRVRGKRDLYVGI